jgi:hypothetical protein
MFILAVRVEAFWLVAAMRPANSVAAALMASPADADVSDVEGAGVFVRFFEE